jgi:polyhydroxybutyrate depolymerase
VLLIWLDWNHSTKGHGMIETRFFLIVGAFLLVVGCDGETSPGSSPSPDADGGATDADLSTMPDVGGGDLRGSDAVPTGDVSRTDGGVAADVAGDAQMMVGSAGCGSDPSAVTSTLDVDGQDRTFVLSLPDDYDADRPYPLIFAWHGLGGSAANVQNRFGFEEIRGSEAILVYPDALPLDSFQGRTGWALDPDDYDFDFFDALSAHLSADLCVDPSRIFSTGHSFGGFMSNSLGCHRGDVLNAIAPVAGGIAASVQMCDGALAVWSTHGSADTTVEISRGEEARDMWLGINGCDDTTGAVEPSPCAAYQGCERDIHWCEHTGRHGWPDFAGAAIWAFFMAQ